MLWIWRACPTLFSAVLWKWDSAHFMLRLSTQLRIRVAFLSLESSSRCMHPWSEERDDRKKMEGAFEKETRASLQNSLSHTRNSVGNLRGNLWTTQTGSLSHRTFKSLQETRTCKWGVATPKLLPQRSWNAFIQQHWATPFSCQEEFSSIRNQRHIYSLFHVSLSSIIFNTARFPEASCANWRLWPHWSQTILWHLFQSSRGFW